MSVTQPKLEDVVVLLRHPQGDVEIPLRESEMRRAQVSEPSMTKNPPPAAVALVAAAE